MSKDRLLRQIGIFVHGEQWQAPLARDLRVSERTIRRWVGGTEEIPPGVWRDLSAHLEIYDRTLGSLVAQVKDAAGLTQAHPLGIDNSELKITRVALPKEKLEKLTTGERSLFLLLGYASNQINTLWEIGRSCHEWGRGRSRRGKGLGSPDPDFHAAAHRHHA